MNFFYGFHHDDILLFIAEYVPEPCFLPGFAMDLTLEYGL